MWTNNYILRLNLLHKILNLNVNRKLGTLSHLRLQSFFLTEQSATQDKNILHIFLTLLLPPATSVCQEFCPPGGRDLCTSMHHRSHDKGGLCPGGSLSRGTSVQGGLCPGGLCPGGSLSVGSLSGGSLSGGSLSRGSLSGGLCPGCSLLGRPPPYCNRWAVCILLECILVLLQNIKTFLN